MKGGMRMSVETEAEHLRSIPAFAHLERGKLKLLAFASACLTHAPGDFLFHQGDPGDSVYILIEGRAEVIFDTARGPRVVAELRANDIVGEIAVLCDVPRTASVRAIGPLRTLAVNKDVFFRLVTEQPEVGLDFMRLLADRYNRTISTLLEDEAPTV